MSVWLVFRCGANWEECGDVFHGAFSSREGAIAACEDHQYFVYEPVLDQVRGDEDRGELWEKGFFPKDDISAAIEWNKEACERVKRPVKNDH